MGKKVAILTDSNSGITQEQGKALGIPVLPMPFYINDELFYEDITLTQEDFYRHLEADAEIHTSMPVVGDVLDCWDRLLKENDEIVYIPMSSGLSSSCATAVSLADDYDGRVQVVNNQRISVTQRQSVLDAMALAQQGWDAARIREYLERTKFDSSIYIYLPSLKYLKKENDKRGGISIRIKEVPEILSNFQHLKFLELEFTDKVVLPKWLDRITIDRFYIKGIMTDSEKNEIKKRFPKVIF